MSLRGVKHPREDTWSRPFRLAQMKFSDEKHARSRRCRTSGARFHVAGTLILFCEKCRGRDARIVNNESDMSGARHFRRKNHTQSVPGMRYKEFISRFGG